MMESSNAAKTATVASASEVATPSPTTVSSPEAATSVSTAPDHDKEDPTAVTTDNTGTVDDSEPKIEQVTPADMEPQTPPTPVGMQEPVDPLAVPEESPEISTTSVEPEIKSTEVIESTIKDTEQAVEQDPLAGASHEELRTSEEVLKPSTSAQPAAVKGESICVGKSSEVSESIPTSTSSPGENPEMSSSSTVEEQSCASRIPPTSTPPPLVESSTASPEKAAPLVDDSPATTPKDVPIYTTTSTVDSSSSSGSGDKTGDSNVETDKGPNSNGSDIVNSISNDCSSSSSCSSSIGNSKEAESQPTATENGSTSLEANTTTMDASDRARTLSSAIVPPSTIEEAANAVIEKDTLANNVDTTPGNEKQSAGSLARLNESQEESDEKNSLSHNSEKDRANGHEDSKQQGSDLSNDQKNDEMKTVPNSAYDANGQEKREEACHEHRPSSAMPPDPDTGPPVEKKLHSVDTKSAESCNSLKENVAANGIASSGEEHCNSLRASQSMEVESSQNENLNGSVDGRTINTQLSTGVTTGRTDHYHQQQQTPPVSARNPLQFTEVANDEVELKVDSGHLLDRVIKLSLLKGLQDSGKRLAKSSLIISGAGASIAEGANGEATLATTSSLSKAKSAAAGLRLMEEHKTTPPALVANGAAGNGVESAPVVVTEIASTTKEAADSQNHPTAPIGGRIRHSSDTTVSSSPSGELDCTVRSSSNSSLDFREEERSPSAQAQEAASPASSQEASSSRSSSTRDPVSTQPAQTNNNEHLPVKARKPQYYASIPDFSKQQFSSAASMSTVSTSTTTSAKSLAQLHMKTPDFSRLVSGTVPSSQTSPSSTTTNSAISTVASSNVRTTSELKISNPDFTKGFGAQHHSHYSSSAHGASYPSAQEQPGSGSSSSQYVTPDTFSKLIKERNYIADLQLKNPPRSQQGSADDQPVAKSTESQNDYPSSRRVVVDTTSAAPGGTAPYGHASSTPISQYRRTSSIENGMEQEPKAHVINKPSGGSSAPPQPPPAPPSQSTGGHHAPKTWNPPEFSSKHFTHGPPNHSRPAGSNGAGPSSTSPSSRDPSPASSSSSPHQPSYGQHPGGLVNYAGKTSHTGPSSVVGSERIIVNNVRTYYPEASVPPASASIPPSGTSSSSYPSLPKVKDPEFRLDQNKEQLLLQEGTIVTVKQPYSNHTSGRGQLPPPTNVRSPSAERREAQMMQNSQDILYRDFKQHKKPTSSVISGSSNTRPAGPSQNPVDRRSPYDPAAYYSQSMHHHRPPIIPPQGSGMMHPPPPNWPGPAQHLPPHQMSRGAVGPGARSSPQDNGASPVSSPAPVAAGQHHYHSHPHQGPYYGQYKNAPSPVSGSTYGTNSSPAQPQGSGSKYTPQQQQQQQQQQHYPGGTVASDRRLEVVDRTGVGSGNYKGLDYNMEQKFAEVYQAHQAKEKQAAAEAAASSSARQGSRPGPGAAGGSPGISSTPGSSSKGPTPYGYEQYHAYYQHSQATPSPTSTPSPVPSPLHRKYSGPPSRDPSPQGQQSQQSHQHHRYGGSSEALYHVPPGGPPAMYVHSGTPKSVEQGAVLQPIPPASYYQSQPCSSSSSSYSSVTTTFSNRSNHTGAVLSPNHPNPAQQSVISGNPYDRYVHAYATGGQSHPASGGQQQQQLQQQQQTHHSKPSLPYPAAGRLQGPPPLQPAPPSSVTGQSQPVIQPPLTGSKNIPVRVIATAPPAAASVASVASLPNAVPTVQSQGTSRSSGQSSSATSSSQPGAVAAMTPVIIAPVKRESPLDLSVKTVKTKADSTGCDDYAMSASNSSISSSSSSSSSGGNGRPREVVPKVDFSPNFQKHIPPRNPGPNGTPGVGLPAVDVRQPQEPPQHPTPAPSRHVSVISPAIPPGYDKKTDAYMSANYRAVGGPMVTPAYQYSAGQARLSSGYDGSSTAATSSMASASSKSVYYPPTGQDYGRTAGKSGSGSIVTGQAAPAGPTNSRSNPTSQVAPTISPAVSQAHLNDRIEDRKFVESMLKKKTSPSSDVMADLQAGKFPTRIPQTLAPKKRAAAAAAAAAAAEAAMTKAPVIQPGTCSPTVPSPAKVAKYEELLVNRAPGESIHGPVPPPQGPPSQGAPAYDGRYPNHTQLSSREGPYPSYGPAGHHYPMSDKRPTAPELSNGPAVHPSVITTNYHHHPQTVLQQQQPHQYTPDARNYPHHPTVPVKSREDHIMPVYHPPHLRGGSAASYSSPHAYAYPKDEPNAHPPYPLHNSDPMAYHKGPPGAVPPFRYGDSLKAPPPPLEHTAVHHMQSHIHYTGASAGAIPKVGHRTVHQHQQSLQPHVQQQQQQHHSSQSAESIAVPQHPPNVHPNYGPPSHHRGVDQSVISKLRTSLEMKEYEKQRINQLRKQPCTELGDEDRSQKTVLPSPAPAPTGVIPSMHDSPSPSSRFRTKGELKGYTPLPTPSVVTKAARSMADSPPLSLKRGGLGGEEDKEDGEEGKRPIVPPVDIDGASALDILDWGSACNEFVEQLQTGKKRGRRKRTPGTVSAGSAGGRSWPVIDSTETAITVPECSTTDLSAVPKEVLNSARSPLRLKAARDGSESSSDEDKPLLLLRQQSQQQQKDQEEQRQVDCKALAAIVQTEKAARNLREKQRFELQQKHEAKLGRSSSTDSETARLAFVAAQRAKARVRKLRHRSSVAATLSLKSSDGDGDVTADGAEDDRGKPGQKRVPHALENSAKRKRIRGPGSRSSSCSSSSSSSENSAPVVVKKPENEMPRKRGRPKGTGAGGKRAQQTGSNRCQTGTNKQETNEKSDLSSDEESRAVRTPHKNGSTATNADSAKKREGGTATGGGGSTGGSSGSGNCAGGKAQQGSKVSEGSVCNDGSQKEKHIASGAKKKSVKTRTNSRSKAESSSDSSSDSSSSSSSEAEEEEEQEEEAEETMTRSRSKREAERRRSNSKVLRNDKIVENCPNQRLARNRAESERTPTKKGKARKLSVGEPTPKRSKSRVVESDSDGPKAGASGNTVPRKRTRQASKNAPNSSAGSGESATSSSEDGGGQMDLSERLRSRKVAKKLTEEPARKQSTAGVTKSGSRRESTTSARGSESSTKKRGNGTGPSSSSALAGVKKSLKELNQTPMPVEPPDHFYPGWEKELYEYKRSIKVPPELITIDGYMHRISSSLPDLDSPHHSDGSETFSEIVKKLNQRDVGSAPPKRFKTKAAAKQQQQQATAGSTSLSSGTTRAKEDEHSQKERKKIDDDKKFRSIIEILHRRCIAAQGAKPTPSTSGRGKGPKSIGKGNNSATSTENSKPKQEFELLPTPGAESESLFSKNSKKKKSLFDTAILKSRTRTEQKAMQSKEMIREVFGGDEERPQSAPPLSCRPEPPPLFEEGLQNITYDERYNQLMRNIDRIVGELDGGGAVATATVKQEPPDEEEDDEEEEPEDEEEDDDTQDGSVRMKDSERDTPSIASERGDRDHQLPSTPLSFNGGSAILSASASASGSAALVVPAAPKKRGRGHRTSRRKGSSGFDYIRKKKKPSQQHHHGNHQQHHGAAGANGLNGSFGVRKVTIFENIEGKDETHISKEIRSWVLNKGAGESVMHKAARLGYTDVIVYCLERLDMDPDLKDNAGYTPLHEACAKGHLDIANYLLQYGASHSEPAQSGMRPLHEAVENSFVEIVRLLLAFGADPMLATYRGMTPMELAESDDMTLFLEHHLNDVQSMAPNKIGWKFDGPWKIHDPEESGCNIFSSIPGFDGTGGLTSLNTSGTSSSTGAISSASSKRCDSNSNIMHYEVGESVTNTGTCDSTPKRNGITNKNLPVGLRNGKIKRGLPKQQEERPPNGATVPRLTTKLSNDENRTNAEQQDLEMHDIGSDDGEDGEILFEYEEADRPLPPLYILKDEYNERWMLMSDLCSFLKFKSKEAVLRQICSNNSAMSQRELIREMKIEDFLTRANCLQLLCAGEKLNIHASKVMLVKYNDSVKSLLRVQSFITRI
ncbi:mucin-12-like [Anopheles maculipalpis]|uniref:mucin-12-like n=1 Tax=Anopheles maculipalpis TaxID=1496333 RepID=UPI002159270D|nr:mucin-12-like [Anopheles maculipalpis]